MDVCMCSYVYCVHICVSGCGVNCIPPLSFRSQIKALKVNSVLPEDLVYQICNCTHIAKLPTITSPARN